MKTKRIVLQPLFRLMVVVLLVGSCLAQTGAPVLPTPGFTLVSREQQQQLGFQAAAEIYKQLPLLPHYLVNPRSTVVLLARRA